MSDLCSPVIILAGPQIGENIGAAARAMLNCGLTDLRLVAPRDGWPNPRAEAMASGADLVLDQIRIHDNLGQAIADLHKVFATTARHRDMRKPVLTPQAAATEIHRHAERGQRCGILFGPERIGLINDEVILADAVLSVPLNPEFRSLNLAQAVLLVAWEWYRAGDRTPERTLPDLGYAMATKDQLLGFFDHLEQALDHTGFFKTPELRPSMVRNLRNLFHRAELSDQEVRTLHGVITSLIGRRRDEL